MYVNAVTPSSRTSTVWSRSWSPGRCLSSLHFCSAGTFLNIWVSQKSTRCYELTSHAFSICIFLKICLCECRGNTWHHHECLSCSRSLISPTSDGAGAAVLASEDFVRNHSLESQAVEIIAQEMVTDLTTTFDENSCIKMVRWNLLLKMYVSSSLGTKPWFTL